MAISKARRNFRVFLGVILLLSLGFFSISSYFYVAVKQCKISMLSIAPTLFQIDVYQHYAKAYFEDNDGKYKVAMKLYKMGFFHPLYGEAGQYMMIDLAEQGHAPSQVFRGDMIWAYGTSEERGKAISYYEKAAEQNYTPAIERLAQYSTK